MSTTIVSLNNGQQILQQSTLRFCLQLQFTTASKIPWKDAETLSERKSASTIIITLSAGIIIINSHGDDQKLDQERDQDVFLLAELQTVKKSSSIRAPANNRQHSGVPSYPL
jgi:hypothetical protein